MLEVVKWDPAGEAVVVSGWGPASDWYRNVLATSEVAITVSTRRISASHRVLPLDEAVEVMADYERRNRYLRPVVKRVLGHLVGWPYDGSDEARCALVAQLPMVAFRSASS